MFLGESIALVVAVSWTATALFAEIASKRIGALELNVWRMALSLVLLSITLWVATGTPYPSYTDSTVWDWLLASGFVGYVLGDYCLFNSYLLIGSRFGQLFMTLASPFAALAAWVLLGERLSWNALLGMCICITGIGMSVLSKPEGGSKKMNLKLPVRGVLLGIGAGAGQGVGLVLSKVGMTHYQELTPAMDHGAWIMIPFAATMMRACAGLVCFSLSAFLTGKARHLVTCLSDLKGVGAGLGAVTFGPFIGVSLSLMAAQMAPAGVAQTIMSLTPIFILWPSKWIFGTRITPMEVLGAVIAVAGVALFFI